ncbi:polysaccharide biosynthesis C-terminal domain-containing protein [Sandarakinorhabdus sp.]|uniref:polysaccharide biosynthesis C-terminal domain-containing protein n=1 Tax=Sandarakinorhabdus sp. TaxID=1916663 RepID=UPI00286E23A4|nr:polysaccharide biosynthesis C-terminal domain-containing protein [Sandarakinorhabdus sp.]
MSFLASTAARLGRAVRDPYVRQSVLAFGVKLGGAALSFVFNLLIARHYGAAGTGSFGLALTTSLIASVVALVGLDYILLRRVAGDIKVGALAEARGTIRNVTLIVIALGAAVSLLLWLVGVPLLRLVLDDPASSAGLGLAALAVIPLALQRLASASMRGLGSMIRAQLMDGPFAMALALAGLIALMLAGQAGDAPRAFALYVVTLVTGVAVAGAMVWYKMRGWPAAAPTPAGPLLASGWPVSITVLSMLLADWTMMVIVGASGSAVEVGQFRVVVQIGSLINLIVVTFDTVAGPRIAAAHRVGETRQIFSAWRQAIAIMTVMAGPLVALCLIAPGWMLGLFGPQFVAAAPALQIVALGQAVNILTGPAGSILVMTGREQVSLKVSLLALVLLAVLGALLVPKFGIVGAAMTLALVTSFRKIWSSWEIIRAPMPAHKG